MNRPVKKRNKKWTPPWVKEGVTREEYLLLPWKHLMPQKAALSDEEVEELDDVVEVEDDLLVSSLD